jgi:hypothetical protein
MSKSEFFDTPGYGKLARLCGACAPALNPEPTR